MWATKDQHYNSMKWHLADESTLEERIVDEGWQGKLPKKFITITCGGVKPPEDFWHTKIQVKVRDTINIYQNNVCSYCRNKVLRDEGIETSLLK
jgi:hypothetical protein